MPAWLIVTLVVIGAVVVIAIGIMFLIAKFYRKVDQGRALIINKMKIEPEVTFTGGVVVPIIHRAEVMDISVKTIELERSGTEGLICKDNIRADIKVTFFVRVNKTKEDVLKVAQAIGCARASDQDTLEELFMAKFSEALKTVGKRLEFEQLYTQRDDFKDQIIEVIGQDLNGYGLEDAAIDYLEQTPMSKLDPANILDAQGIRKITELTSGQNVQTNELKQKERMEIGRQDLAANEAIFRFEQQEAEALAKKLKEIEVAQQQQTNEALRVRHEEEK
ncbi:MAG: putative membrane protein YqiK, partial [Bradymonadia bacterium]